MTSQFSNGFFLSSSKFTLSVRVFDKKWILKLMAKLLFKLGRCCRCCWPQPSCCSLIPHFFLLFTSPLSNRKWFFVVKARPGMTEFHPEFKLLTFNNQKSVHFFNNQIKILKVINWYITMALKLLISIWICKPEKWDTNLAKNV